VLYQWRIPDTTLHDVIVSIKAAEFAPILERGVKEALRDHELTSDFPVHITTIDGKALYSTAKSVNSSSDHIGGGGEGKYRHMVLRAMHVSSPLKLMLGQRTIESKGSETKELIPFVDSLQQSYGRTTLLDVISVDADMVSKANAAALRERGFHYIMALKGSQGTLLLQAARAHFFEQLCDTAVASTRDKHSGATVMRTLYRAPVHNQEHWEHDCRVLEGAYSQ
jgi:hypothetical protein